MRREVRCHCKKLGSTELLEEIEKRAQKGNGGSCPQLSESKAGASAVVDGSENGFYRVRQEGEVRSPGEVARSLSCRSILEFVSELENREGSALDFPTGKARGGDTSRQFVSLKARHDGGADQIPVSGARS
jgi:hypothetical protein